MSVRFLADADLNFAIVQSVRLHEPAIDFKSANEAALESLPDDEVLEVAAAEGRVLVLPSASVGEVVASLLLIWSASSQDEWADQIHYLPVSSRHLFR